MSNPLQINDLFWTLQGEGRWSGRRALFVRLPYCNYNCPWCDTEYNSYDKWSEEQFLDFARQEPSRFAVVTGGEPLMHKDLGRILNLLKKEGFYIACETNGSFPAPDEIDFVTVSPKRYTKNLHPKYFVHDSHWQRASEFKYVVDRDFDFSVLQRHQPYLETTVYSLSPEFSQMKENVQRIVDFIRENPRWQLSVQTHKWLGIP